MASLDYGIIDIINLLHLPKPKNYEGKEFPMKCPVCCSESGRKTLYVNFEKNTFNCFKCGASGKQPNFYLLFTGMEDTPENRKLAVKNIKAGIANPLYVKPEKPEKTIYESPLASVEVRNKTYTLLLNFLTLEAHHRENLIERGLDDTDIARLGYRSLSEKTAKGVCQKLLDAGCTLEGVPGFYKSQNGRWMLADTKNSGILVPFKDFKGKIFGIQKRLDVTEAGKGRFRWLSSSGYNHGTKADGGVHISGNPESRLVVVTEGGMKADIINTFTNKTVIAVPGVNSTKRLRPILEELRDVYGLEILKLAFDMDYITNPQVEKAYNSLCALVKDLKIPYHRLKWDENYKGLDDYLKYLKDTKGNN